MATPDVAVIDYGMGNLLSVRRGLECCGATVVVTSDPDEIMSAGRVVLPGVGAFADAMQTLERLHLVEVIRELAQRRTPLLGICLGMQLLMDESEEFGRTSGLGLIPGRVIPLPPATGEGRLYKIPHIGWNGLWPVSERGNWQGTVLEDVRPAEAVYFVHSFMAVPSNPAHCIADCKYGGHRVAAVIGRDRITACQFHPEKSGAVGLKILRRFCVS